MVVETAPPAPFIIAEAEFLLELLVVALDPPSQLGEVDQTLKADLLGQCGKPIFGRLGFALRPLDQQPLFGARLAPLGIAMRRPHALPGEARRQPVRGALAPGNGLPSLRRQVESQCFTEIG